LGSVFSSAPYPKWPKLFPKILPTAVYASVCPPNKLGTFVSEPIKPAASAKHLAAIVSNQVQI
jgi:hypothetical protein